MHVLSDFRYALRGLRNRPGFAFAIVITLALGIGANAAMFSVVDRLLFRSPPLLRDASSTHLVYLVRDFRGRDAYSEYLGYARYHDLLGSTAVFERAAIVSYQKTAVGIGEDAREMDVAAVSASFFGLFDAAPLAGRYFRADEDSPPNGVSVAVISYAYWQVRFGGSPVAIGQEVQIGPSPYTIIGVAPRGFAGLWPDGPPAAYIPITTVGAERSEEFYATGGSWWLNYGAQWAQMIVERKEGITSRRANSELSAAFQKSYAGEARTDPRMMSIEVAKPRAFVGSLLPDRGPNTSNDTKVATWVAAVAVIVWLIACANVANLLLARALRRRREIAVRMALGVSRSRLAVQLLSETALLGALGGLAGILIAQWGRSLLKANFMPNSADASVLADERTLLFAGGATLVAALLTGLAPLLHVGRADLTTDLKSGGSAHTAQRSTLQTSLLILQGALSVVLLVGAGLFVRSLQMAESVPLGYDADRVLIVDLQMRGIKLDSSNKVSLRKRLVTEARAIPGVQYASVAVTMPFWMIMGAELSVPGVDSVDALGEFDLNSVTPDYFAAMGTRILRGRGLTAVDVAGAPLSVVVSEDMAFALWPGEDALGRCVKVGGHEAPCAYVVGVAENIKSHGLGKLPRSNNFYMSWTQFSPGDGSLFLRVTGRPEDREVVRRRLQAVMPGVSYVTVTPFSDVIGGVTKSWRLGATMFSIFGLLALALAAIGLYSVITYNVEQRTRELGVRVALGAQTKDLLRLVVGEGMKVAVLGVLTGTAIALVGGRWITPLLFEVSSHDPAVYGAVIVVLLGIAALASFVPARRAGEVDPMITLRAE